MGAHSLSSLICFTCLMLQQFSGGQGKSKILHNQFEITVVLRELLLMVPYEVKVRQERSSVVTKNIKVPCLLVTCSWCWAASAQE